MKNNSTELVFILDASGSMAGLEGDTIGGFNAMIEKQRKQEGDAFVSTILFDDAARTIHDRLKLSEIPKMTDKDYFVGGCTALIDTLGDAIKHIKSIHKYARKEDVPEHTVFVITTDGMENASHRFTAEEVKMMIEQQKEAANWEFLFIGANIDAVETAAKYGIAGNRAVNYCADSEGTDIVFNSLSDAIGTVRASRPLMADWGENIQKDYIKRNKK